MGTGMRVEPGLGPGFTRFWIGEAVSSFGTYVTLIALQTLVVLTMNGTAQEVGWLNSARWLPYLVLGLVVGAWVERRRRRPVMVASDLVRAGLLAAIPTAWATGLLSFPLVLVVVTGYGAASLINDAASMSFVPRLVPRAQLQLAHARIDGADAVAQSAGPALAGLLVKLVGAPLAVLVDAATYLFSAAMIATLPLREVRSISTGDEGSREASGGDSSNSTVVRMSLRRQIGEGLSWVYRGSGLATLAVATHIWFAANAVLGVVVAPFALLTLDLSPFQFGLATAGAGLGGVVGAVASSSSGRRLGTGGAVIAAHILTTVAVCLMALAGVGTDGWSAAAVLGLGQFTHGMAIGVSNSHELSYRQALTPDDLQARTNTTIRSFNRAVIVVVAPLAGLLADRIGMRQTLLIAATIFGAAVVILAMSPFRVVKVEGTPPPGS